MPDESKPFRFLTDAEFSLLDADAKSRYIVEAIKAVSAIAEEIAAHVKGRNDETKS